MALVDFDWIKTFTKSSPERVEAMAAALRRIDDEGIEGDIVECGVWRGGNIILARKMSPQRVCWLYDTFDGMTEPGAFDVSRSGDLAIDRYRAREGKWAAVPIHEVVDYFIREGVYDPERLRFVEGPVEQTLLDERNLPDRIALLRLDTDWYQSTKIELEVLYPRLVPGGTIIVDDYGHWLGARRAVEGYFGPAAWTAIDYTAVMMVKR